MKPLASNSAMQLAFCYVGVVGSLLVYGVLQERIMTLPYGPEDDQERFKYSLFLVLCNRILSCAVALVMLLFNGKMSEIKPVAPVYSYAAVSFSNVVATTCQYEALKYLWFPLQSLGKCAKMFPVMLWGMLMLRKKYTGKDYLIATSITMGCTMFILTGDVKSRASNTDQFFLYGGLLMLGYLAFDGFTSTFQDKLFKGFQMTTYNQVLYTTLWSSILSSVTLFTSGQLAPALAFVSKHPEALVNIMALSAAATCGSLCISYTIKSFGALTFAQIMTLRQFLSIVLSSMVFMHPLTTGQWVSAVMIVATMYYQSANKGSKGKDKASPAAPAVASADEEAQKPLLPPDERAGKL